MCQSQMSLIKNILKYIKIILKINMSKEEVNIKFVREIKKRSVIWDAYSIDNLRDAPVCTPSLRFCCNNFFNNKYFNIFIVFSV